MSSHVATSFLAQTLLRRARSRVSLVFFRRSSQPEVTLQHLLGGHLVLPRVFMPLPELGGLDGGRACVGLCVCVCVCVSVCVCECVCV